MSKSILSLCLGLLLSTPAAAQVDVGSAVPSLLAQASAVSQSANQPRSGLTATQKGALIGAGSGAAFGIVVGNLLCDGSHCGISGYARDAAIFGALGAGMGALVGHLIGQANKGSNGSSPARTTVVAPIVSTERQGVIVSIMVGH
jgi:hypothetical protein